MAAIDALNFPSTKFKWTAFSVRFFFEFKASEFWNAVSAKGARLHRMDLKIELGKWIWKWISPSGCLVSDCGGRRNCIMSREALTMQREYHFSAAACRLINKLLGSDSLSCTVRSGCSPLAAEDLPSSSDLVHSTGDSAWKVQLDSTGSRSKRFRLRFYTETILSFYDFHN